MEKVIYQSAKNIAASIRNKTVSVVEVVDAHLQRIEETNTKLNAVVQLAADRALQEAHHADEILAKGDDVGVLHGVPMTVKDSLDTEGVITTGGTKGRTCFIPDIDATVVSRLRNSGAIMLGKTNTPEFTLAGESDNLVYGRTNNPYDVSRTSGGSSGGAAAIVAVGGAPFDIGSDTGGSIRNPAHSCGIAGLKPNSGRVPRTGHIIPWGLGAFDSTTQNGPMARFVEDIALILPVISGPDWIDPSIIEMPLLNPDLVKISGLRVAMYTSNGIMDPSVETVETIHTAASSLLEVGCLVEEARPSALAMLPDLLALPDSDGRAWLRRLIQKAGTTEIHPWVVKRMNEADIIPMDQFTALLEKLDQYRSSMLSFMKDYDAILCPVAPFPAPAHGATMDEKNKFAFTYTSAYNYTGWPGVVVRGSTSDENLPIGVQIVSRPWREDVAIALAFVLESSLGGWQAPRI